MSETTKAIWLFIYVLFSSAIIIGIVRHISGDFHTFQTVFFYNFFALLCFTPWVIRQKKAAFRASNYNMLSVRAVLEFVSFSFSFYALTLIPLPVHTALLFVTPVFGVLVAIIMLKERPSLTTYLCIALGFIGVLIITRPGIETISSGILFALLAAMGFALCGNTIKILTRSESSRTIAFYMLLMSSLISLPFAAYFWVMPSLGQLAWFAAIGWLGFSQQLAVAAAFSKAPYTTLIPLNFIQLVFVSVVAYVCFGEVVDMWTIGGSVLIITGILYNAYASTRKIVA